MKNVVAMATKGLKNETTLEMWYVAGEDKRT